MLSADMPFEINPKYGVYMPVVDSDEDSHAVWGWLPHFCNKIRDDLIATGRWGRQCIGVRVWIGALAGRAARAHLHARLGVSGRQLCCSVLGCTERSGHEAFAAAHV